MPVYHSSFFNDEDFKEACKFPIVPLKDGNERWPYEDDQDDIVEEAIKSFRANCLFKSFDIRSNADRLLIYLTLFTLQCIKRVSASTLFRRARNEVCASLSLLSRPFSARLVSRVTLAWPQLTHPSPDSR